MKPTIIIEQFTSIIQYNWKNIPTSQRAWLLLKNILDSKRFSKAIKDWFLELLFNTWKNGIDKNIIKHCFFTSIFNDYKGVHDKYENFYHTISKLCLIEDAYLSALHTKENWEKIREKTKENLLFNIMFFWRGL